MVWNLCLGFDRKPYFADLLGNIESGKGVGSGEWLAGRYIGDASWDSLLEMNYCR
jgi:hypothetical protein